MVSLCDESEMNQKTQVVFAHLNFCKEISHE